MGSFADFLENKLLDHVFGCGTRNYTSPTNIYVALSTTTILDNGTGMTEPSGNGYARVSTGGTSWTTAASGALSNSVDINFPTPTGTWGTVTYFALMDAASAGNMLAWGALTQSKTINGGDVVKFAIGDLDVTLD